MFRPTPALLLAACILADSAAQTPPPVPAAGTTAPAAIQPPAPGTMAPPSPLPPPAPGQMHAAPAPGGRIPEVPAPALTPVPPTSMASGQKTVPSTSGSGQFIVHGQDPRLKTAFSARCDEIKDELGRLLHDSQPWVLPIVVLLNAGEGARNAPQAVSTSVAQITHGGFHLQVTVNLRPDLRPSEFRAEVVRALMMERVLRSQPEVTSKRASLLPDWVLAGVMEALDYRRQARPSTLFAAIFKSGKIFGIEEIIEASPTQMDALSKTIYRTSCCALVLALLDQPEGSARLNRFLSSLATDARPERELLNRAFPSFASSAASLNKWWALQLAGLAQPKYSEPLAAADTLKALEDALTLRYQARASEIPKPRPTAEPVLAATTTPADEPPAPKPGPGQRVLQVGETTIITDAPPPDAAEAEEDKDGPGFFRSFVSRLNPFSKRRQSNAAIIESAIEEAAREEALSGQDQEFTPVPTTPLPEIAIAKGEGTRTPDDSARKPLFNRWFGGGSEDKPAEEDLPAQPPATGEANAAAPAPTPAPEAPQPPATTTRPSRWNPLNWFRRTKPQPGQTGAATQPAAHDMGLAFWQDGLRAGQVKGVILQQAATPAAADAPPVVAEPVPEEAPAPAAPAKKRGILSGLFGGKKGKKEEPAPPPPAEAPAEAAPAAPAMPEAASKGAGATKEAGAAKGATAPAKPAESTPPPAVETAKDGKKAAAEPAKKEVEPKQDSSPAPGDTKAAPPPGTAPETGENTAMTPGTPTPQATETAPVTAEPVPESRTAKRTPMRLKDLFGIGKKPAAPAEPPPPADPAAPAAPAMDAPAPAPADGIPATPEMLVNVPKAMPLDEPKKPAAKPAAKPEPKPEPPKTATRKEAPEPTKPAAATRPQLPAPAMTVTEPPAEKPAPKPEPPKTAEKKEKKPEPKPEPKPEEPLVAAAIPVEDYAAIMKRPDRRQILDRNLAALRVLQERCAILFRPVVADYILLLTDLREDKAKNVDERLKKLRQRSLAAVERSKAVRDLLDVHEANYSASMSGTFDDYLTLPARIQEEMPPRQDPISKYLDALEREFAKP